MAEVGQDVQGWSGDDIDIYIQVLGFDGNPLDLTECVLHWGLGDTVTDPATLIKTSADSAQIEFLDRSRGQIVIHLDPPDTQALVGPYRHELKIVDAFGAIETVMVGWVTILENSVTLGARRRPRLRAVAAK